ncbi:hypothetical protein [Rathayibacter rathayi]|nr:hypothetical protein [Rathayibacter rathayi]
MTDESEEELIALDLITNRRPTQDYTDFGAPIGSTTMILHTLALWPARGGEAPDPRKGRRFSVSDAHSPRLNVVPSTPVAGATRPSRQSMRHRRRQLCRRTESASSPAR